MGQPSAKRFGFGIADDLECPVCGAAFRGRGTYCSRTCFAAHRERGTLSATAGRYQRRGPEYWPGVPFVYELRWAGLCQTCKRPVQQGKYCSRACADPLGRLRPPKCTTCGTTEPWRFAPSQASACAACHQKAKAATKATKARTREAVGRTERKQRAKAAWGKSPASTVWIQIRLQRQEAQGGICSICDRPATTLDHDHATGAIRGALCSPCNASLGGFRDDPAIVRAAAAYLDDWKQQASRD